MSYNAAIYARLSEEDIRKKNSDSIGTQIALIQRYLESKDEFNVFGIYSDVNYSGSNFKRPDFMRMMQDIEKKRVNCVVVKDLSRFGRNLSETSDYLERVFPLLGIRFISINDQYDSCVESGESNILLPIRNLLNEAYARDISKKLQSAFNIKQKRGEFCGAFAPYGYKKNGNRLEVDEDAAPIVKQIFKMVLEGASDINIVQRLNDMKILPPSKYRFEKGILRSERFRDADMWYKSAVKRITENPIYTGTLAQGKTKSNYLHGGGRKNITPENWIVVNDNHPTIIDQDTYDRVKKIRNDRKEGYHGVNVINEWNKNRFKGICFCADCKAHIMRHKVIRKNDFIDYRYMCNTYEQVDKNACSKKSLLESELYPAVYESVKNQIELTVKTIEMIQRLDAEYSLEKSFSQAEQNMKIIDEKIAKIIREKRELIHRRAKRLLSDIDFIHLKNEYDNELVGLETERKKSYSQEQYENKWSTAWNLFKQKKEMSAEMIKNMVERIDISDYNRIEITLRSEDIFKVSIQTLDEDPNKEREVKIAG